MMIQKEREKGRRVWHRRGRGVRQRKADIENAEEWSERGRWFMRGIKEHKRRQRLKGRRRWGKGRRL
jgi:hypothetical protein